MIGSVNGFNASTAMLPGLSVKSDVNSKASFSDFLKDELNKTNELILQSDKISDDFAAGKTDNIHQVLIAVEKADTALQLTLQVRNKIMEAYNEIMRMQL